jgi:hypothetical protein
MWFVILVLAGTLATFATLIILDILDRYRDEEPWVEPEAWKREDWRRWS